MATWMRLLGRDSSNPARLVALGSRLFAKIVVTSLPVPAAGAPAAAGPTGAGAAVAKGVAGPSLRLLGTGAPPAKGVAGPSLRLLGTGAPPAKVVAGPSLRLLGTGAPSAGGLRFFGPAGPISRERLGAWTLSLRPAPVALITGVRPVTAGPLVPVRAFFSHARKGDDFSTRWSLEKQIMEYGYVIKQAHDALIAQQEDVKGLLSAMTYVNIQLHRNILLLEGTLKYSSPMRTASRWMRRCVVLGVAVYAFCLFYLGHTSLEDTRRDFVGLFKAFFHEVLQSPELQNDAQIYGGELRKGFLRWSDPRVVNKDDFAEDVSRFAYTALSVIVSYSGGRCTKDMLLQRLKDIGFYNKARNVAMLNYLTKLGFINIEVEKWFFFKTTYCSASEGAVSKCISGEMKSKIRKAVIKEGSMEDMLKE